MEQHGDLEIALIPCIGDLEDQEGFINIVIHDCMCSRQTSGEILIWSWQTSI